MSVKCVPFQLMYLSFLFSCVEYSYIPVLPLFFVMTKTKGIALQLCLKVFLCVKAIKLFKERALEVDYLLIMPLPCSGIMKNDVSQSQRVLDMLQYL